MASSAALPGAAQPAAAPAEEALTEIGIRQLPAASSNNSLCGRDLGIDINRLTSLTTDDVMTTNYVMTTDYVMTVGRSIPVRILISARSSMALIRSARAACGSSSRLPLGGT